MRIHLVVSSCLLAAVPALAGQSPQTSLLTPGPHAAGFRLIETHDPSRTTAPTVDYLGRRAEGDLSVPMQIGHWYPARRPAGRPMSAFDLRLASLKKEHVGPVTAADSAEVRSVVQWAVQVSGADSTRPDTRPDAALAVPRAAYRDAPQADGRFPVAIIGSSGSIANVSVLAEHLASRGWIVLSTPSSDVSARLEVNEPRLAVEDRVRALEFLAATAHNLPGADLSRLAVIGINFDSYAAIEFQMRWMRAAAVVTINGWETIENRFDVLRGSQWFDPARIRVPLLNFHWDEAGPGFPPANLAFLEQLRYADRRHYTVRGLNHFGLVGDPLSYPFTPAAQRTGYQFLIRTVAATLTAAVGAPVEDRILSAEPAQLGFPADLLKESWHRPALTPIPTRREFAEILWDRRDIRGAERVFREARARDSAAQLFTEGDMGLFGFRYQRMGRPEDARAIYRLTLEAYPGSFYARNNLGNFLLAQADTTGAVREFDLALDLLGRNTSLAPSEKASQEQAWRAKVARLRPPRP